MEKLLTNLSVLLQPYKEIVGLSAIIITMLQLLAPSMILLDIRKQKSTSEFSIVPFIGGAVLSILYIQFGFMMGDDATIKVNIFGFCLSVIYTCIFYYYTPMNQKISVWTKMGIAAAFAASLIGYTQYEDPKVVEFRYGLILTGILYLLIASPLFGLGDIIKNKSTAGLPFPMILTGTFVGLAWLIYGVILNSGFMVAQNLVAVLLSGFQLSLFVIYPNTPIKETKKQKDGKKKKQ